MPVAVYDNLIAAVRGKLPAVYHYFDLRRRKMKLSDIHHYDTYVPILSELDTRHTWNQAVDVVIDIARAARRASTAACSAKASHGRWCDRYPNQGKRSGAFSCGSYDGWPYILMNYQPDVLDHVFTLAHEAGHSMHSYYSAKHQPYRVLQLHDLRRRGGQHVQRAAAQPPPAWSGRRATRQRAYLINREIDAIRGTIIRQTMFAEFEKIIARAGRSRRAADGRTPQERVPQAAGRLLRPRLRDRRRAEAGVPAHPALLPRVLRLQVRHRPVGRDRPQRARASTAARRSSTTTCRSSKAAARSGRSTCLNDAGVDMTSPEPVETALTYFERLVDELDELL